MKIMTVRVFLAALLTFAAHLHSTAQAQTPLDQEWQLDPRLSTVYMQTVKKNALFEVHQFNTVEGTIDKNATANVKIDLASINSSVDLRDVRMRFLLFETFKFPFAEISAQLDRTRLQQLESKTRISYPLSLKVNMHGIANDIETTVWVTRIGDRSVSVSTVKPIIVTAKSFALAKGVAKLADAVGGIQIAAAASISFDLVFVSGSLRREVGTANAARNAQRTALAARAMSPEECETRFNVISRSDAIYFKSGSAQLDRKSTPLLVSVADIANRCQGLRIRVEGHTDNTGSGQLNRVLSEARARSVVDFLAGKGVEVARIQARGYGEARPIAPNNSDRNRAKNRRIEFRVLNGVDG